MATAKPMAQPNNKKYGLPQDSMFTDGMVDHDMHLKMSKKIAQLTKVIYALNTKNDEHEQIVKSLQQQHDREKFQLVQETKTKIETLRSRLGVEVELRERITSLENCVEEHEKQKKKLLHDFDSFKGECADNEASIRSDSNQKLAALTKQLQHYQQEFEQKVTNFENLVKAFEDEKEQAIDDLRKAHQIEISNLLKTQQSQSDTHVLDLTNELQALRTELATKLEQADAAYNQLKEAKEEMEEDYMEKFKKSKQLYEKELELLQQRSNEADSESQRKLKETIDKLNKDLQFQEMQNKKRVDGLLNDLSLSEETVKELQAKIQAINEQSANSSSEQASLLKELEKAKAESADLTEKYRELEREIQVIRQRCSDQSEQLVKKSGVIGELNAAKMEKESQMQKLSDELSDVSRKLKILQDEKNLLMSQSSTDVEQKNLEVQALEQALKDLRIEKKTQSEKYQADISMLENLLEEEKMQSSHNLQEKLSELKQQHLLEMEKLREEEKRKTTELELTLKQQMSDEIAKLEDVNKQLQTSLTSEIATLKGKLDSAETELERMKRMVGDTSNNLGAATSELTELRTQVASLRQQLESANRELQETNNQLTVLQAERKSLQAENAALVKSHEQDLKLRLEEQNKSLELSWMEKLKKESAQLKMELENQFASDRASAIKHLSDQKDQQIEQLMMESEAKLRHMMSQLADLERRLHDEQQAGGSKIDSLKESYEQQIQELTSEIERLVKEYEGKLTAMSSQLEAEWKSKLTNQIEQGEAALLTLKNKHIEDMTSQMTAHKATMDMERREADNTLACEIDKLKAVYQQERNTLLSEMESRQKAELEMHSQTYIKQVAALKMEVQRAVELTKRKEGELQLAQEEYSEKLSVRDRNIRSLEADIKKLNGNIQRLSVEIENKKEEMLQASSEASRQLRMKEEFLTQEHCEEMEQLQTHHAEETQQMLAEFTRAQAILKEKIEHLSTLLQEAEERYMNREPREEDLNTIEQLRRMLKQKDQEMQQLIADKQYFQMELVNRETNFTKVFAGSKGGPQQPQVGFINPLAKKKKGEKGPTKYAVNMGAIDGGVSGSSSASSSTQRLRPIAGSPIHDEKLNPNHVLPTPSTFTKKFVQ